MVGYYNMNEVWKKNINAIMVREELTDDDDAEPWQYTREENEIRREANDVAVMRPDADLDKAGRRFFAAFETISQKALSVTPICVGSEVLDDFIMATSRAVSTWSSFVGNVRRSKEEEFERALRSTYGERSDEEEESDFFGTVMMSDDISLDGTLSISDDDGDDSTDNIDDDSSEESGDDDNNDDDDDDGDDDNVDDDSSEESGDGSSDDDGDDDDDDDSECNSAKYYLIASYKSYMKMSAEHHPGVEVNSFASWALTKLGLEVTDTACTAVQEMMMKRKRDSDGDDEEDGRDEKRLCI